MLRASPSAAAVTIPTRSPVNGPGPAPHTTASSSRMPAPALVITSRTDGMSSSPWARAFTVTRSARISGQPTAGNRASPATTAEVAVSTANTSTTGDLTDYTFRARGQPSGTPARVSTGPGRT